MRLLRIRRDGQPVFRRRREVKQPVVLEPDPRSVKAFRKRRRAARAAIIAQANKHTANSSYRVLTKKNLQEAVHIVRHWGTVEPETLLDAGFHTTNKGR
jgi:hypothetical protein